MEEWITRKSPEYRELQEKALAALDRIEAMIETLPGHLNAESYLTSEEVRNLFGLSQRSLQTYRRRADYPLHDPRREVSLPDVRDCEDSRKESRQTNSAIRQGATAARCSCFSVQRLQLSDLLFGEKIAEVFPAGIKIAFDT